MSSYLVSMGAKREHMDTDTQNGRRASSDKQQSSTPTLTQLRRASSRYANLTVDDCCYIELEAPEWYDKFGRPLRIVFVLTPDDKIHWPFSLMISDVLKLTHWHRKLEVLLNDAEYAEWVNPLPIRTPKGLRQMWYIEHDALWGSVNSLIPSNKVPAEIQPFLRTFRKRMMALAGRVAVATPQEFARIEEALPKPGLPAPDPGRRGRDGTSNASETVRGYVQILGREIGPVQGEPSLAYVEVDEYAGDSDSPNQNSSGGYAVLEARTDNITSMILRIPRPGVYKLRFRNEVYVDPLHVELEKIGDFGDEEE